MDAEFWENVITTHPNYFQFTLIAPGIKTINIKTEIS